MVSWCLLERIEGFCCRKFPWSMAGIAKPSSNKLAIRLVCHSKSGAEGLWSRVSLLKSSGTTGFDRRFRASDRGPLYCQLATAGVGILPWVLHSRNLVLFVLRGKFG